LGICTSTPHAFTRIKSNPIHLTISGIHFQNSGYSEK
jgi:hypothetical protein